MKCILCEGTEFRQCGTTANGNFKYCCEVCNNIFVSPSNRISSSIQINFLRFKNRSLNQTLVSQNIIKLCDQDNDQEYRNETNKPSKIKIVNKAVNSMNYKLFYGFGLISLCAAIAFSLSYSISGNFDERYFSMFYHQANAFLHGRIDLAVDWTQDLIPFNNKIYLAIPPLNAFLILPFIYFFGDKFTETWFANILYTFLIIIQFIFVEKFAAHKNMWQRSLLFIFLALGTMILPCAIIATSWFNAVIGSCIFLSLAWLTLYYARNLQQDILAITFLAIAATGRFHLALLLPVFVIRAWRKNYRGNWKALIALCIPAVMFIVFVLWWNWVRFGNPLSLKYEDLVYADFFRENIQKYGFRNIVYIFPNIYHGIIAFPKLIPQFPFFNIDDMGNGVLAVSPLFLYILFDKNSRSSTKNFAWLSMAIIALPVFTHCSTGWRQFGYRYFLDFFPFAVFLLLRSKVNPLRALPLFCIALSLWFNIFGAIIFLKPEKFGM